MSKLFCIYAFSEVERVELDCLLGMILCVLVISSDKGLMNLAALLPIAETHCFVIFTNLFVQDLMLCY
jgi:hypothetical protein